MTEVQKCIPPPGRNLNEKQVIKAEPFQLYWARVFTWKQIGFAWSCSVLGKIGYAL